MNGQRRASTYRQLPAWGVHLFTASGAALAVFALMEIDRGNRARAAIYMLIALSIDSVDGTLARRARVAERVPWIDGRRLDDIVDYLNYAIVPVVFLLAGGSFVHWSTAALPVIASAYGFAQVDAKTEDDFFLGWPSYWNVVALYVWLLELSPGAATAWIALFSALVFVPLPYVYPSKLRRFRAAVIAGGFLWVWVMAFCVWFPAAAARARAVELSLAYPAFYVVLSAWLGQWWRRSSGKPAQPARSEASPPARSEASPPARSEASPPARSEAKPSEDRTGVPSEDRTGVPSEVEKVVSDERGGA